jgi:hypothetical protein
MDPNPVQTTAFIGSHFLWIREYNCFQKGGPARTYGVVVSNGINVPPDEVRKWLPLGFPALFLLS